jgi:hypothetical protein
MVIYIENLLRLHAICFKLTGFDQALLQINTYFLFMTWFPSPLVNVFLATLLFQGKGSY